MNLTRLSAPSVTQSGSIASGSPVVTGLTTAALEGALWVTGTGIPRRTLVKSIDSAGQVTLTANATATNAAASLTFTLEPVMLGDAKDQLRIAGTSTADDVEIARKITAARLLAEEWFSRSYITTSWRLAIDGFAGWSHHPHSSRGASLERTLAAGVYASGIVKFPRADLVSVSAVNYIDVAGATVLLDPSRYQVIAGAPGYLVPAYNTSWPATRPRAEAVTVDFTAGYGPSATSVPEHVKEALLMLVAHFYENREATVTSSIGLREAPLGVQALLSLEDWGYRG